jgi:hypothetical protein
MAVMDPDHEAAARIALTATREQGFALAGGHALTMHGIGSRPSKDVDIFTDQQTDFDGAVGNVRSAFEEQGYDVEVPRRSEEYARLEVTKDGRTTQLDMGRDYRSRPPVESDVGPVLSVDDAVGSKVGAAYGRGEAKDFVDLQAAAQHGRYSRDELLALGDEREGSPMDRPMLAEQLASAARIPDAKYAEQGLAPDQTAALKQDLSGWAQDIRTRAEKPDLDNSMRLLQTGQARPGASPAVASTGEADRRHSPYEQSRNPNDLTR